MPLAGLAGYIVVFFSLWTFYNFEVASVFKMQYPGLYRYDVVKLLLWTLPVFVYLKYENRAAFTALRLRSITGAGVKWAVCVSLFFVAYQFIGTIVIGEELRFNLDFAANKWIKGVILVGFTEEILFRGFLLQKIAAYINFGLANLITSLLFLFIHFPGWLALNMLPATLFLKIALFAFIFIFSMMQGYVLKKTDSLWVCIVIHSINNLAANALGA